MASCKTCKNEYVEKRKTIIKFLHENNIKLCKKCNEEKSTDEFYLNTNTYDGLNCQCKKCIDEYYKNNKEEIAKNFKIYTKID